MPDLLAVDVLIFPPTALDTGERRHAVRAAAVLYSSTDCLRPRCEWALTDRERDSHRFSIERT